MSTDTNDRDAADMPRNFGSEPKVDDAPVAQAALPDRSAPNSVSEQEIVENHGATSLSTLGRLSGSIPTILVFMTLAGIGYWGHYHGWRIPRFSELAGNGIAEGIEWCDEHGVAEAECISCNAELMPKGELYGWCQEHGVHECVLHHPQLTQLSEIPEITPADFDLAARAIALRSRTKNDRACKMHLRRIQFPSRSVVDKAGVDINLVDRGPVVESVSATGEILYDPTRVARLASRAGGSVWRVEKNVGDPVQAGELLALVDAAEVGLAKAELFQSAARLNLQTKTYKRLVDLGTVVAGKRILEAETAVAEAEVAVHRVIQTLVNLGMSITYDDVLQTPPGELRRRIQFLGLPRQIIQELDPARTTSNLIPIASPRDGIVLTRDVVAGEVIDTTKMLFTVADTRRMWLVLNVPLEEAKHVTIGQTVIFRPDGADHADTGTLTWISTKVDNETRTVKVRGELPNDDGHLRDETFGVGEIVLREEANAIVVPSEAVHWEGCCHVAFVRDKDFMKKGSYKVFHTRSVRPGVVMPDYTEMIAGLLPGEVVVTKGSAVLRAELLKGNLGAG